MTLKKISLILAAVLMAGCISCGDSGDDGSSRKSSSRKSTENRGATEAFDDEDIDYPEGSYAKIEPLRVKDADFKTSLDTGIDQTIESYSSLETKPITFYGNKFVMNSLYRSENDFYKTYSGTFTVDKGKILFSYETTHTENYDVDISEDYSGYDEELLSASKQRRAEALKGMSEEEQNELIKENRLLHTKKLIQEDMLRLNETGTYIDVVMPRLLTNDRVSSHSILPIFANHTSGPNKQKEQSFILSAVDDFLCVPTYGFRLKGSYRSGEDFTIKCNTLKAYQDDPNSKTNQNYNSAEANLKKAINRDVGDLNDTRIEFSNGKWTWTNSKGELLNNGPYLESKEYEGLIGMFIDENSKQPQGDSKVQKRTFEQYKNYCPLLFYISGDGTIWYPGFVKID